MAFCIKDNYVENPGVCYFLDDVTSTRGIVFQPDVYTFAEWTAETAGVKRIVDVGCGWADKLARVQQRHTDWEFAGIDFGANIRECEQSYPWGRWYDVDIDQPFTFDGVGAVVICSDVIEHVADPCHLVAAFRTCGAVSIIISTPERDLQYGPAHFGPSPNPHHVREWNGVELAAFLTAEGLNVRHVGLTRGNDRGTAMATQLVVATP